MESIIQLLGTFLSIYILCIFVWALLSWVPMINPQLAYNSTITSIRKFLDSVVEPYVRLFRFIPPIGAGGAMIDLSALVAILTLVFGGPRVLGILASALGVS